jgi:hypothetical protein
MIQFGGGGGGGVSGLALTYPREITWQPGGTLDTDNLVASTWAEVETLRAGLDSQFVFLHLDASISSTFVLTTPSGSLRDYLVYAINSTSASFTISLSITDGVTGSDWFGYIDNYIEIVRTGTSATPFLSVTGSGAPIAIIAAGNTKVDNQNPNSPIFRIGGNRFFLGQFWGSDTSFGVEGNHPIVEVASNSAQVQVNINGANSTSASNCVDRGIFSGASIVVKHDGTPGAIAPPAYSPDEPVYARGIPYGGQHNFKSESSGSFSFSSVYTWIDAAYPNPFTATMPTLAECEGRPIVVCNTRLSQGRMTLTCSGSDTFQGGATTLSIAPATKVTLYANPSAWHYQIDTDPIRLSTSTVSAGGSTCEYNQIQLVDPSGGAFPINTPLNPSNRADGERFGLKNATTSTTAVTVAAGGDDIEDPSSPGTISTSVTFSGAGKCVVWELFDAATNPTWLIVGGA